MEILHPLAIRRQIAVQSTNGTKEILVIGKSTIFR